MLSYSSPWMTLLVFMLMLNCSVNIIIISAKSSLDILDSKLPYYLITSWLSSKFKYIKKALMQKVVSMLDSMRRFRSSRNGKSMKEGSFSICCINISLHWSLISLVLAHLRREKGVWSYKAYNLTMSLKESSFY